MYSIYIYCMQMCFMYLSLGCCLLTWPVTGQSLRTLPYCIPHHGLETGHQRLKEEEEYRTEEERGRKEGEERDEKQIGEDQEKVDVKRR